VGDRRQKTRCLLEFRVAFDATSGTALAPRRVSRTFLNGDVLKEVVRMLWTIVVVLLVLWLLGFAMNVVGGVIHVLLVIAVIVILINLIQGRNPV
jgi:hypothetical protein